MLKFERNLVFKIAMNKLQKFISQAFGGKSLLHGALLAVITALGTDIQPFVNSGSFPDKVQLIVMGKAALIVFIGYIFKNGFLGSSQTNQTK